MLERAGWTDAEHLAVERALVVLPSCHKAVPGLRCYTLDLDTQGSLLFQAEELAVYRKPPVLAEPPAAPTSSPRRFHRALDLVR